MSKKTVKIVALVIAVIFLIGILGPLAYMYVFSAPSDDGESNAAELAEVTAKLEAAERLEKDITRECGERLRVMCEKGMVSYLDVIFSSKSISDFTDRLVIAGELAEYDKNIMNTIGNIRKEISDRKKQLETLNEQNNQ